MPIDPTFSIDTRSLEEKLKSLTGEQQIKVINSGLRAGADVYQAAISDAAPVKKTHNTPRSTSLPAGALRSDVIVKKQPNQLEYDVQFGKYTSHVARWVDQGHRLVRGGRSRVNKKTGRTSGNGKQIGTVDPHPFFDQAFESATPEAEDAITKTLTEQLQKTLNG